MKGPETSVVAARRRSQLLGLHLTWDPGLFQACSRPGPGRSHPAGLQGDWLLLSFSNIHLQAAEDCKSAWFLGGRSEFEARPLIV